MGAFATPLCMVAPPMLELMNHEGSNYLSDYDL